MLSEYFYLSTFVCHGPPLIEPYSPIPSHRQVNSTEAYCRICAIPRPAITGSVGPINAGITRSHHIGLQGNRRRRSRQAVATSLHLIAVRSPLFLIVQRVIDASCYRLHLLDILVVTIIGRSYHGKIYEFCAPPRFFLRARIRCHHTETRSRQATDDHVKASGRLGGAV